VKASGVEQLVTDVEPQSEQVFHSTGINAADCNDNAKQESDLSSESEGSNQLQDWGHLVEVKRTFLCKICLLHDAAKVNQSTSESHGGINPRRVIVLWD